MSARQECSADEKLNLQYGNGISNIECCFTITNDIILLEMVCFHFVLFFFVDK